jgi:head-tail adaptor
MKPQSTTGSKFNKRIQIQAPNQTINADGGGGRDTYTTLPGCESVPAQFVYMPPAKKGDESFTLQQVQESIFVTINIRYRPSCNIAPQYQVVYGTRIFNIRSVYTDAEARRIIIMQCEELQAKGTLHT